MALSPDRVKEIEDHIAYGTLSDKEIARKLRCGKDTVRSIRNGTRTTKCVSSTIKKWDRSRFQLDEPGFVNVEQRLEIPVRCPGCGGYLVQLPCRKCRQHP